MPQGYFLILIFLKFLKSAESLRHLELIKMNEGNKQWFFLNASTCLYQCRPGLFFFFHLVIWKTDWLGLRARAVWLHDIMMLCLRIQPLLYIASETAHVSFPQYLWWTSTVLWLTSILLCCFLCLALHLSKEENVWGWRSGRTVQMPAFLADEHP